MVPGPVADSVADSIPTPFGVDGEGEDGRYTLLSASDGSVRRHIAAREKGLTTEECFEFLLNLPARHKQVFGFSFTYDVNMMLGSLDLETLKRLTKTGRTYWGEYRIKHIVGKQLVISHKASKRTMTVWDLYPWIQSSFVQMLKDHKLADEATIQRIASMKDKRDEFRDVKFSDIIKYNYEECDLLAQAGRNLLNLIASTGYECHVYYSPGSLASAAMERHRVRQYRKDPPTKAILDACEQAYYGGRSEVNRVGPVEGPIYEYDIRSAYPYAATLLPCFACGRWVKLHDKIEPYSLVKIRWNTSRQAVWGPYPVRPATGSLRFPRSGETWVWGVEALAGLPLTTSYEVVDGYTYLPGCDHHPFGWLNDIYRGRQALKKAGNPQEYIYKLILNSAYGKLAQRPSSQHDHAPKQRFLPWAGLITATTRAMLLEQIGAVGENLLSCATDGILTSKPLEVPIGDHLGQWESGSYASLFIAGPGFYFAEGEDTAKSKARNRGIARADVSYDSIRQEWDAHGRMGKVLISTRRFIGYRLALQRLNSMEVWREFVDVPMVKSFELSPRREWVSGDPFDGRTIAPSLAAHRRTEKADASNVQQLTFALWNEVAADRQLDKLGQIVMNLDPWSFDPTEQPDYLIDELSEG